MHYSLSINQNTSHNNFKSNVFNNNKTRDEITLDGITNFQLLFHKYSQKHKMFEYSENAYVTFIYMYLSNAYRINML